MIAVASSGRRFRTLLGYLEKGRDGESPNRIEWMRARNLVVDDPRVAARVMQATAEANPQIDRPVYHVAVSFHPSDRPTQAQMEHVADRLIAELGLGEHQALIIAHADKPHAHVHVVLNRIHPETGRAWNRWQDRVTTQRVLREEERALGFHETPGRLYQLPGRELAERTPVTQGEHHTAERTGEVAIVPRLRAHLAEYRQLRTWESFESRLGQDHLRLERKGQGLVITDGERQVKASRVARDFSLAGLEARLGPYTRVPERDGTSLDDRVAGVVRQVQRAQRAQQMDYLHSHAEDRLGRATYRVRALEWAAQRARATGEEFDRELAKLYLRPQDARALFDSTVRAHGEETAAAHLEGHPSAYGRLRPVYRPAWCGVFSVEVDRDGLARARIVAARGRGAARDAERLRTHILESPEGRQRFARGCADAYVYALTHAKERLRYAEQRTHSLQAERQRVSPLYYSLSRDLAHMAASLGPRELQEIGRWLTSPQTALLLNAREATREAALGIER